MITAFERERIEENIGTKEAKISFLQEFPKLAKFNKGYSVFYTSGLFQLQGGQPILVLPWFLKNHEDLLNENKSNSSLSDFFELINEIKSFRQASIDLGNNKSTSALDIIMHSYLLNLEEKVKFIISFNFQQDIESEEKSIKGKWCIVKDLKKGPRPLNFSCEFTTLEQNIPILLFTKSFVRQLTKLLRSKKNLIIIENILNQLKDVDAISINKKLLAEARSWVGRNPKFESFNSLLDFAENLIFDSKIYSKNAGISYQFKMDKFFESLVLKIFTNLPNTGVHSQTRENVLGGALWKKNNQTMFDDDVKKANQYSIPDVVIEDEKNYIVLECKYKPFRIPYINNDSNDIDLVSFGRNDRNQLLSFIMSLRPTPSLSNKKVQFSIIFPCRDLENYEVSELVFSSAKLHIDPIVRNLVQNKREFNDSTMLKIKFVGLNVSNAIKAIIDKNSEFSKILIEKIESNLLNENIISPKTKFQSTLEKRLALASIVVDKSKNDPTLGRVKLAKIFYLADSHLNLKMDANYVREAAGPLDQRLIYNDKIGLEVLGDKYSFFKTINVKKNKEERIKYSPSQNIHYMLDKSKEIFFDKYENIMSFLDRIIPLNTDQSEIIATLYACWNDLIISKGNSLSDELIINEFLNNWHDSKKRFQRDRLITALAWMRDNDLVPSGIGKPTSIKHEKIPSGF
ncbi:MAG: hypothetical protein H6621_00320 [Halobacteriovoraceae bacterium]|nr:hypothetical protein [Halobacteriovoraceae bacterium]MCB9093483.1 hypothetical protein [Halobacteriovoraceae bacterium]